jgi:hypothetical protein
MNPLNYEALTVIESGVTLDDGSSSPGRLQEVGIIHIDYESCNDLYDGDIVCVYSVMLCVQVCLALVNILQGDSAVSLSIGKAQVRVVKTGSMRRFASWAHSAPGWPVSKTAYIA